MLHEKNHVLKKIPCLLIIRINCPAKQFIFNFFSFNNYGNFKHGKINYAGIK